MGAAGTPDKATIVPFLSKRGHPRENPGPLESPGIDDSTPMHAPEKAGDDDQELTKTELLESELHARRAGHFYGDAGTPK